MLSQEGISESLVQKICKLIPMASHNQRGYASIFIDLPPRMDVDVRNLAEIVHAKLNQVYSVLKREDELEVVYKAHLNPTFVEDACREVAKGVYEFLREKMRPESIVRIRVVSEESIHQHDAFAQIEMSFEQLKNFADIQAQGGS
jgi:GTP cyclohydrolase-4